MKSLHQQIVTQNLGKRYYSGDPLRDHSTIREAAEEIIESKEYLDNWFGADGWFGSNYLTGILKEVYFITRDDFMTSQIYALRKITPEGIETVVGEDGERALSTLEQAEALLEEVTNEL